MSRVMAPFLVSLVLAIPAACESSDLDSSDDGALPTASEPAIFGLADDDPAMQLGALERLDREWEDRFTAAVLEYVSLAATPELQRRGLDLLCRRTGECLGFDLNDWYSWVWAQDFVLPDYYADFKSRLYRRIDDRFGGYFSSDRATTIDLSEVRWGGVLQDGIPPLRSPAMIAAKEADYLADNNVVFGVEVNGDVRAYPKRILAWHEMFTDTVGGVRVVGVYCTLCGSVILYESEVRGVHHEMGTSGFLYRSNKLMYDRATQSLWNTLWGTPAVGPLVGKDIRLPRRTIVTTTWGEWRRRHPDTTVLSLDTGFRRDYGEGVAYRDYFATDELMFNTSQVDKRLPNKAEVLGLVFHQAEAQPLAISAVYARQNPVLHERVGEIPLVVLTDSTGAMRVYETRGRRFDEFDGDRGLVDSDGNAWVLYEDRLEGAAGEILRRLPSHSAFWFGWYGAYTNTRLLN